MKSTSRTWSHRTQWSSVLRVSAEHRWVWRRKPFCPLIFGSQDPTFPKTSRYLSARNAMHCHQSLLKWPTPKYQERSKLPELRKQTLQQQSLHRLGISNIFKHHHNNWRLAVLAIAWIACGISSTAKAQWYPLQWQRSCRKALQRPSPASSPQGPFQAISRHWSDYLFIMRVDISVYIMPEKRGRDESQGWVWTGTGSWRAWEGLWRRSRRGEAVWGAVWKPWKEGRNV